MNSNFRTGLAALACAVVMGTSATAAWAHDDGWRHWGHGHGWREHGWRGPRVVYAPPPAVVYAPPPAVVYAPPPAVIYAPPPPPPGISIVVPLDLR